MFQTTNQIYIVGIHSRDSLNSNQHKRDTQTEMRSTKSGLTNQQTTNIMYIYIIHIHRKNRRTNPFFQFLPTHRKPSKPSNQRLKMFPSSQGHHGKLPAELLQEGIITTSLTLRHDCEKRPVKLGLSNYLCISMGSYVFF